jgi:hypothetical protein
MTVMKWFLVLTAVSILALPIRANPALEQKKIHNLYNEGDFDGVIRQISAFRNQRPQCSRDDSIFIAKHLAVVYAANPKSVGQGKYWMNELLKLMPAADLVGMYVSDEIDRIFENVRKEFVSRQQSFGVDTNTMALPERPKDPDGVAAPGKSIVVSAANHPPETTTGGEGLPEGEKRFALKRSYWILGGSALAATAVGLTTYIVLSSSRGSAHEREITIPRNPQAQ